MPQLDRLGVGHADRARPGEDAGSAAVVEPAVTGSLHGGRLAVAGSPAVQVEGLQVGSHPAEPLTSASPEAVHRW